eukprot:4095616-Prymnesium_polylepis.1
MLPSVARSPVGRQRSPGRQRLPGRVASGCQVPADKLRDWQPEVASQLPGRQVARSPVSCQSVASGCQLPAVARLPARAQTKQDTPQRGGDTSDTLYRSYTA